MTPNDIDVLLHYHVSLRLHERADAPAVEEAVQRFLRDGILEHNGDFYDTTARGKAWVEMILRVPYPRLEWVEKWVDEKGTEIL